jgi:methylmalonyl-CoA/ethylmalonyl-CoA epimerase
VSEKRSPQGAGAASTAGDVTGLAHVAIATRDADALAATLVRAFRGERGDEELLDNGGLRVLFVRVGPVTFELLEPRRDDHTVAKFLATRGEGLHHVSLEVGDVAAALARCQAASVQPIDAEPRAGAHGSQVAFLHPKSLGGVLFELSRHGR